MPRRPKAAPYIIVTLAIPACTCRAQDKPDAPVPKQATPSQDKSYDSQIGKSKLEKESGTVNDCIFELLPNYVTVETSKELPPLTMGQKIPIGQRGSIRLFHV